MTGVPAVLKFSRDRRGYEHFYLVQPSDRRGNGPPRVLYWFRTPPGVKVGRPPFDDEMRRRIAAQNPGVVFDWPRLLATPIPPPAADVERWRERRRLEKAEKAARAARRSDVDEVETAGDEEGISSLNEDEQPDELQPESTPPIPDVAAAATSRVDSSNFPAPADGNARPADAAPPSPGRKRHRRRRRRGRSPQGVGQAPPIREPGASNE